MPKAKIPAAKRPVKRLPGPKRTVAKPKAPKPKATKTKPKPKWTQRQDGEKTFDYRTAGGKTKRRYQRVTSAGKKWGGSYEIGPLEVGRASYLHRREIQMPPGDRS